MRTLLICTLLLFITGCGVKHIQPEVYDRYSDLKPMVELSGDVQALPQLPLLTAATVNGHRVAVMDIEDLNTLSDFRDVARQNTMALQQTIDLYNATVIRDRILVESLRLEERRANRNDELYTEAENTRRDQEQAHAIESTVYKVIITIMGLAWTLL